MTPRVPKHHASEITTLKLDADWVVMSACNTAGSDKPGAEPLSGLASAFFYAGARAMLALIDDPKHPWAAHPSVWPPFIVVGEGGAAM